MPSAMPPGVPWLANKILLLCAPSAAVFAGSYLFETFSSWSFPRNAVVLAVLFAFPAKVTVQLWLHDLRRYREAKSLGARTIPRIPGRWPGNFDVLMEEVENTVSGYITSSHWKTFKSPFNFWMFWDNAICTSDPEHMKVILTSQFDNFPKSDTFRQAMASILGTGVFNSDGEMWRFHRAITRPFFSRDRVTHFDIFDDHANTAIALMKERFRSGYALNFQDLVSRFTLDSATDFLFGSCLNTLAAGLPYPANALLPASSTQNPHSGDVFADAFAEVQKIGRDRCTLGPLWPLFEVFGDKTAAPMRTVSAFVDPILKKAVERKLGEDGGEPEPAEKKAVTVEEDDTLLDYLLKQTTDPVILKDEILNMLGAGRDTTASLLTFTMYSLAMNPSILAKLRAEILARVGTERAPTYDDIREMKFLRATLNETLRLYPAVPVNLRKCVHGTTWPAPRADVDKTPYYIPPGAEIVFSVWEMHRRKDLWGEDADEYDPERFIDARMQKYLLPNPFIYLPFAAGPRICLGQQFAYNEASFMLVKILQAFSGITLEPSAQPPSTAPPAAWADGTDRRAQEKCFPKASLTLFLYGGLWVKMEEAKA